MIGNPISSTYNFFRGFKMFGKTEYQLSLVKNYVAHWGLSEAVRELIQNALDSASPFVYEFVKIEGEEKTTFVLNSEFAILPASCLLLGATSKADDADAIGSFGEGFKIALLVLTRLGFDVDMFNGDKLWKPRFKFVKQFGEELLVIDESPLTNSTNKGLTFHVHGLDEDDLNQIVACCLKMQSEVGEIRKTTRGDILMERPGELYVGSLFICKTNLEFGYNIKPEFMKLERDRQTVSDWDLKDTTKEMWFETKDFDLIAKLIEKETPDLEYVQYGAPEIVKEACYALFRSKNPGAVIARNSEEMKKLVELGMTVYVGGGSYYSAVSSSRSYRSENPAMFVTTSPTQHLSKWLSANRGEMRSKAIESFKKDLIELSKNWKA